MKMALALFFSWTNIKKKLSDKMTEDKFIVILYKHKKIPDSSPN